LAAHPITPGQARYDGGPSSLLASPWAALGPRGAARRLHHRAAGNGPQALGVHGVQAVAQLVIMAGEQVAVAVQGERDRGVPGPHAAVGAEGRQWPRTKRSDDATAVYLDLSDG
jgi:hypothetical protein